MNYGIWWYDSSNSSGQKIQWNTYYYITQQHYDFGLSENELFPEAATFNWRWWIWLSIKAGDWAILRQPHCFTNRNRNMMGYDLTLVTIVHPPSIVLSTFLDAVVDTGLGRCKWWLKWFPPRKCGYESKNPIPFINRGVWPWLHYPEREFITQYIDYNIKYPSHGQKKLNAFNIKEKGSVGISWK